MAHAVQRRDDEQTVTEAMAGARSLPQGTVKLIKPVDEGYGAYYYPNQNADYVAPNRGWSGCLCQP